MVKTKYGLDEGIDCGFMNGSQFYLSETYGLDQIPTDTPGLCPCDLSKLPHLDYRKIPIGAIQITLSFRPTFLPVHTWRHGDLLGE